LEQIFLYFARKQISEDGDVRGRQFPQNNFDTNSNITITTEEQNGNNIVSANQSSHYTKMDDSL